ARGLRPFRKRGSHGPSEFRWRRRPRCRRVARCRRSWRWSLASCRPLLRLGGSRCCRAAIKGSASRADNGPMPTTITVNGVEYESGEAMPADVRRTYEETMAKFSSLGEGTPKVVEGTFGPVHYTTTVRKKIVVNGTTYDDEASMPDDVRQTF